MKKIYFFYLLVVTTCFFAFSELKAQEEGLIAYWNFDDSTAADISGNQHLGTIMGAPTFRPGKKGAALDLNGTADYVTVGHNNLLNLGHEKPMSISIWFKIHQADLNRNQFRPLLSQASEDGQSADYMLGTENGQLIWATGSRSNANSWLTVAEPSEQHLWHHVVVTILDTMINDSVSAYLKNIYLNNKLVKTALASEKTAELENEHLRIGSGYNKLGSESYFYGLIDEVRLYNRAVTILEVNELYTFGEVVGIEKHSNFAQFSIYPNPANQFIFVEIPALKNNAEINIFSLDGKQVFTQKLSSNSYAQNLPLPVEHLHKGIYVVQLNTKEKSAFRKFVIN